VVVCFFCLLMFAVWLSLFPASLYHYSSLGYISRSRVFIVKDILTIKCNVTSFWLDTAKLFSICMSCWQR
jgi:hypothetical protein